MMLRIIVALLLLVLCLVSHGNELTLTFDAENSQCTAQCSTCSSTDDDNHVPQGGGANSDDIDELLNTTSANNLAIKDVLQEIARISSMVSTLKTTATTTSAVVNDVLLLVEELHNQSLATSEPSLPTSCRDVKSRAPSSPSGEYLIQTANGGSQYVYCNMDTLCSSDDGWMRLAYLDMSDPSQQCPPEFREITDTEFDVRACARQTSSEGSCDSITFDSYDVSYSQVCGRLIGYQYSQTGAFNPEGNDVDINSFYVHGVSITRGSPRQHVWTFAAGNEDRRTRIDDCPCNTGNTVPVVPSFVGSDYFCESGYPPPTSDWPFITSDPLWDGERCINLEGPCCDKPDFPWFNQALDVPSTDFLELRICTPKSTDVSDVPVGLYEIYVK